MITVMTKRFRFINSDPPPSAINIDDSVPSHKSMIALDIQTKLQFRSEDGTIFHEYQYPSDRNIQNCGGYIDKLMKYRSKPVREAVSTMFLPNAKSPELAVLKGRSILVDILLTKMIDRFSKNNIGAKAKLFDHGCTVAEHYEMIDQMLAALCNGSAREMVSYYGLDISPIALCAARILNPITSPKDFQLILAEGSDIALPANSMDFSMSIGVANHVHNPLQALEKLFELTSCGVVLVLWITGESQGFWAINHSGIPNYFVSIKDLHNFALRFAAKGAFYFADFTPEKSSTQPSSYFGISEKRIDLLGSYTLVFCGQDYVVEELKPIDFGGME